MSSRPGLAIVLILLATPVAAAPPAEADKPAAVPAERPRGLFGIFGRHRTETPPAPAGEPSQPPPAPVSREAKRFFVFMPFDHVTLTPDGVAAVDAAAAYAKAGRARHVLLVGHTDTSGQAAYNLGQSERYARLVAEALATRGVPQAILELQWKGETELAVPTPDNFREPGNRRVTIDVEF